jgi:hypothetical protein
MCIVLCNSSASACIATDVIQCTLLSPLRIAISTFNLPSCHMLLIFKLKTMSNTSNQLKLMLSHATVLHRTLRMLEKSTVRRTLQYHCCTNHLLLVQTCSCWQRDLLEVLMEYSIQPDNLKHKA